MEGIIASSSGAKTRATQADLDNIFTKHGLRELLNPDTILEEGAGDATNMNLYLSRNRSPEKNIRRRRKGKGAERDFGRTDSGGGFQSPNVGMAGSRNFGDSSSSVPDTQRFREKRRHISTSLATLVMKKEKRLKVVEDGAISALLKLATAADDVILRCVASSFAYLSTEPSLRTTLLDTNTVGTLTSIVQSPGAGTEAATRGNCIKVLCNLALEEGGERKVVRDGGPSIANMAAVHPELLEYALTALLNMSAVSDKYHKIEDVTDSVMHIFEHNHEFTESQDIKLLSIIANLSNLRGNQLRLVEDGAMTVIEGHISSASDDTRALVGHIIANLTTCNRTRVKLVDLGIIRILLSMAKDKDNDVCQSAMIAFHNLSRDIACREKVVAAGAVAVVVRISMEPNIPAALSEIASSTLRILCTDEHLIEYLIRDGVVKALVILCRYKSINVQLACAQSINALLSFPKRAETLIHLGAVGVLVYLCNNKMADYIGEWCAYSLLLLCYADEATCSVKVLVDGVLPSVLKLCDERATDLTRSFCATALAVITHNPHIDTSSSIPILVYMLNQAGEEQIKTDCASALYNLASSTVNCEEMLAAGALLPIIQLTKSDHLDTKIRCAAILSRLTAYHEYHDLMTKNDLRRLLDLSTVDFMETQRRVVITLSNLSENVLVRNMLLEIPETCEAMKLLISRPDDMIRGGCSSILCNLSSAAGSEPDIVQAGVVPTLLVTALLASDKMDCKTVCVKALVNLLADPSCHASMVKDGLIWALSTLAGLGDEDLTMLCAQSLSNLSRRYAKNILDSAVAVKVVMDFLVNKNTEILKYGSRLLLNMLQATTEADDDFRSQAVERMAIVSDSNEEVSRLTILCLCLSSQSEACRGVIVRCGILHSIDAGAIFQDPQLSYAYLTMFGNIAQNPTMRVRLLDRSSVNKFCEMSKTSDLRIHVALAKAMYYVSCSKDNIAFFSERAGSGPGDPDQGVLGIVQRLMRNVDESIREEIYLYVSAFMYNLTTEPDYANAFVNQGIVQALVDFWPEAVKEFKTARLVVLAVTNLACGRVNTVKLVEQKGAMKLLTFLVECRDATDETRHYVFPDHEIYLWTAAVRNLANVIANHETMAAAGVVECLVTVAKEAYGTFHPRDSKGNLASPPPLATIDDMEAIIRNCTATLRSMTYHSGLQDLLASTGAIDIIIMACRKDLDEQSLDIGVNLLHEIESESWKNGTRGIIKDGRTDVIPDMFQCEDLLGAATAVELDFDTGHENVAKMVVSINTGDTTIGSNQREEKRDLTDTVALLYSGEKEDGIREGFAIRPKIEVTLRELESDIHVIVADPSGNTEPFSADGSDAELSARRLDSAADLAVAPGSPSPSASEAASPESAAAVGDIFASPIGLTVQTAGAQGSQGLPGIMSPVGVAHSRSPAPASEMDRGARSERMPDIHSPITATMGGADFQTVVPPDRGGGGGASNDTPSKSPKGQGAGAGSGRKRPKSPSRLQKFDKLVDIIALSRQTKGAYIDDVANTWNEVSKF